ncbi:MAG TPA: sugar phosphate isomerase/epimerase [Armatimonadota bacterium]|nr:sugar phosphate isomerase/epimerase [Armatimonadota bacterium]
MAAIPVGIQLYTVRDLLDEDFTGTLSALAAMGYQGVEFAWHYGGLAPDEMAAFLRSAGLRAIGFHTSLEEMLNPESATYAYARALGGAYLTTGLPGDVERDWPGAIARCAAAAQVVQAQGFTFTYHNHAQELALIDGEHALDLLYAATDPALVQAELDTFWIAKGGAEVVPYIRKHAGRAPEIHAKDMDAETGSFTEVGNGVLDWPAIFAAAREGGAEWVIVEQDACPGNSLDSARMSIENLKRMGLA